MTKEELRERWVGLIRAKAIEYEAELRKSGRGNEISRPDLFDIANEIEAFFSGLIN